MRHVLHELRKSIDLSLCFTPSLAAKKAFKQMVPAQFMFDELNLATLEKALDLQQELLAQKKSRTILAIADDCAFDKAVWRSSTIRRLFMQGRHSRMGMALSMQYLMDLPPDLRTNVSYVFATADSIHQNKKRLFNAFFGCFDRYSVFDACFSQLTKDYNVIVLDNTRTTNSIEESVFWWKASPSLPPFRLCRPVYEKLSQLPREDDEHKSVLLKA